MHSVEIMIDDERKTKNAKYEQKHFLVENTKNAKNDQKHFSAENTKRITYAQALAVKPV